jgi:hypothetical protein
MHRSVTLRVLTAVLSTSLVILFSVSLAWAGRLHPELEAQLKALRPGGTLPVIVEMLDQADPVAAAASPPDRRRLRTRAVVDALRDHANQRQGPVRALLAHERAQGNVQRVVPFWVFNGLAVTATEPVIRRLAARADVFEIRPDAVISPIRAPARWSEASGLSTGTVQVQVWVQTGAGSYRLLGSVPLTVQ